MKTVTVTGQWPHVVWFPNPLPAVGPHDDEDDAGEDDDIDLFLLPGILFGFSDNMDHDLDDDDDDAGVDNNDVGVDDDDYLVLPPDIVKVDQPVASL